jgi:hypothetical protein
VWITTQYSSGKALKNPHAFTFDKELTVGGVYTYNNGTRSGLK